MKSRLTLLAALACGIMSSASAQYVYAVDNQSNLSVINVGTGSSSVIGNTGVFLESIAYDNGVLYGGDTSGGFYTLNTTTGAATFVGNNGLGNMEGMDGLGGTVIASNFDVPTELHELDVTTGASQLQYTSDTDNGFARALTFNDAATLAYTANDGPTFQTLHSMDTAGTTTAIGTLPFFTAAIQNLGGDRYIALGDSGQVYSLDIATAGMSLMHDTGDQFYLGVAVAPVPEPGTMAALGLGLAAIARRRRNR